MSYGYRTQQRTFPVARIFFLGLSALVYLYFVVIYQKFETKVKFLGSEPDTHSVFLAFGFGFLMFVAAFVLAGTLKNSKFKVVYVYLWGTALLGSVLAVFLGVYLTEPQNRNILSRSYDSSAEYDSGASRSGGYYYIPAGRSSAGASSSSDVDDDMVELLCMVTLIILNVVIVIVSATQPHFWVIGGALLIAEYAGFTAYEVFLE